MTKNDSLVIVPIYTGSKKLFQGYGVYKNGQPVKENGKPVILKLQQDQRHYALDENENIGPKKNAPNGIYELGDLDAGLGVSDYKVKFGTRTWNVNLETYNFHSQPALIFTKKENDGVFQGYTINQYDEVSKKIETRGFVLPENITYTRQKDGSYACYYNEKYLDGVEIPHYMEKITREEYNARMTGVQKTKNNTLSQFERVSTANENLNQPITQQKYSR